MNLLVDIGLIVLSALGEIDTSYTTLFNLQTNKKVLQFCAFPLTINEIKLSLGAGGAKIDRLGVSL